MSVHPTIEKAVRNHSADHCWNCGRVMDARQDGVVLHSPTKPRRFTIRGHGLYCHPCAATREYLASGGKLKREDSTHG